MKSFLKLDLTGWRRDIWCWQRLWDGGKGGIEVSLVEASAVKKHFLCHNLYFTKPWKYKCEGHLHCTHTHTHTHTHKQTHTLYLCLGFQENFLNIIKTKYIYLSWEAKLCKKHVKMKWAYFRLLQILKVYCLFKNYLQIIYILFLMY